MDNNKADTQRQLLQEARELAQGLQPPPLRRVPKFRLDRRGAVCASEAPPPPLPPSRDLTDSDDSDRDHLSFMNAIPMITIQQAQYPLEISGLESSLDASRCRLDPISHPASPRWGTTNTAAAASSTMPRVTTPVAPKSRSSLSPLPVSPRFLQP